MSPVLPLDEACIRAWPLPEHADDDDKEARGSLAVIGGSSALGGAVVLAGVAAMRAGAGKVTIATSAATAAVVAVAFPECRVIALNEEASGGLVLADTVFAKRYGAVLVGPGLQDKDATRALVRRTLHASHEATLVLDATAMEILRDADALPELAAQGHRMLVTPHAGELAHLTDGDKARIRADPLAAARDAARRWNLTVLLKGAQTVIAAPDGRAWRRDDGNVGLAVSGSGDTLAGIVAGLAARGAAVEQAAAWGVVLHALAGEVLAARIGRLGFLAREIAAEVPGLIERLRAPVLRTPGFAP